MIEQLLGSYPVADFLEEYYLRLPFARPGGCIALAPFGEWEVLDAILRQPGVDLLIGKEGTPWKGTRPSSASEARSLLDSGFTIGIRHAERHHDGLRELALGFQRDFAAPVDIHLYCTPAEQPGFGWHYDAEDVFLLQLRGGKEWQLRKNTVNPWPLVESIPADMRYEREIMPLMRCALQSGDWLYLPAGYWHRGQAREESVSLSVGLLPATALDVFDFLRRRLLDSLLWRQRLPCAETATHSTSETRLQRHREVFRELGQDLLTLLSDEHLALAFLEQQQQLYNPQRAGEGGESS